MARRYTPEQKETALTLAETRGPAYAHAETGIPKRTIEDWQRKAGRRTVVDQAKQAAAQIRWAEQRERMADDLGAASRLALERVVALLDEAKNPRDAAVTMGILVDKAQLLSGGATARMSDPDTVQAEAREILSQLREQMTP